MYTLKQWLNSQPQPFLEGLAELWGIEIPAASHRKSVDILVGAMPGREQVACALSGCSQAARDALAELMGSGGMANRSAFVFRYGKIRPMGPGALMREKPWRSPMNVTEELWFRGFIIEGTKVVEGETAEVFLVPHELRPWLPMGEPVGFFMSEAEPPDKNLASPWTLSADMTLMLAFIYLRRMRLRWDGRWHTSNRREMASMLGVADADDASGRFGFLWILAQEQGLVVVDPVGMVLLHRDKLLKWLDLAVAKSQKVLWQAWLGSKRWNDLCQVPGLDCTGGSWENDPVGTRRRFLGVLVRWTRPGAWYSIGRLVEAFGEHEPDFQRPNGDYRSWSLRSRATGELLTGREHWQDVEGMLIHFFLVGPMSWLGAVEVVKQGDDRVFRWTERGDAMVSGEEPLDYPSGKVKLDSKGGLLVPWVSPNRTVFRVARIAEWASRSGDGLRFQVTIDSLTHARARGVSLDMAVSFLRDASGCDVAKDWLISVANGGEASENMH